MTIRLKTNNLRIGKRKVGSWSSEYYEVVIIPLKIPVPHERIIAKLNYVFEKDFHGIKKNKSLIWYYVTDQNGFQLLIPIKDNI